MVDSDDRDVIYPPATGAAKFIATSETGESQSFLGTSELPWTRM